MDETNRFLLPVCDRGPAVCAAVPTVAPPGSSPGQALPLAAQRKPIERQRNTLQNEQGICQHRRSAPPVGKGQRIKRCRPCGHARHGVLEAHRGQGLSGFFTGCKRRRHRSGSLGAGKPHAKHPPDDVWGFNPAAFSAPFV